MFRITISGKIPTLTSIDGISKPHVLTQRIYKWADCIGTLRPSLPWEHQWSAERRISCGSVRNDESMYYIEQIQRLNNEAPPVCIDDVYDEHVTMYTIHSHIVVLEMTSMCIFIGEKSKLQTLLPADVFSACVNKIPTEIDSCELMKQPLDLRLQMKPQTMQLSQQHVQKTHDHSQHQSRPQSQEGRQHQPVRERMHDQNRKSNGRPEYVKQPLPSHASRYHGSGEYGPKKLGGEQNGSNHPHSGMTHSRPINRIQYYQEHRTAPLSTQGRGLEPARVRRPEFVPEEP